MQGIVERKNSIPILSNVLAEARGSELRIAATDLDVSLRCGCAAEVVEEGAITVAAKKLFEIMRALPESDVHLKVLADSWTSIECERVSFKVAGLPREDFPALPEPKGGRGLEIAAVCVGMAGAERETDHQAVRTILGRVGEFGRTLVVNDAFVALSAGVKEGPGIVLVAGTAWLLWRIASRRPPEV